MRQVNDVDPKISVVVASRDRDERLGHLLGSLRAQTLPFEAYEVVVVDDGSVDRTAALLSAAEADPEGPRITAAAGSGVGPASARNIGWQTARAPLIAFTDDDCEPAEDWLERALESAAHRPGEVIQGVTRPNAAELQAGLPFQRSKLIEAPSPFFQTCNIVYPRDLLERLGGFDERFDGPAGEDADLGWRALEAGARRSFDPTILVEHAVEARSAGAFVAEGLAGWQLAFAYRRHPALRSAASYRHVFWARSHARLLAAAAGLALARHRPVALALTLPYAKGLAARTRAEGPIWTAPVLVARDGAELAKAIRGSIAARILIL